MLKNITMLISLSLTLTGCAEKFAFDEATGKIDVEVVSDAPKL